MEASAELCDDLDVLETLGEEPEARHVVRIHPHGLVPHHRAVELADEEVERVVAVDVGEVRDVLPVGEEGLAVGVPERVHGEAEARRAGRAFVPEIADVAVSFLGEEVEVAVGVEVEEAIPLADVEVVEAVGAPHVPGGFGRAGVLEELDRAGDLLHEEVEVAVAVDVDELRAGDVEAAEEGMLVRRARLVIDGKGIDLAHEARRRVRARGFVRLARGRTSRREKDEGDRGEKASEAGQSCWGVWVVGCRARILNATTF